MNTELSLKRLHATPESTIGTLLSSDGMECFVLEDVVRPGPKIHGKTAIPAGRYEIVIAWSNRFGKPMPRLLNVPGFEGILIHPGNDAGDTEGCLLVGSAWTKDWVSSSKAAFGKLLPRLKRWLSTGKVYITITNDFAAAEATKEAA